VVLAQAGAGDRVLYRVFGRSVPALMMLGLDGCESRVTVTFGGETVPVGMPLVQDTAWAEGVVGACMWLLGYVPEPPVMLPARPPPTAERWFRIDLAEADETTRRSYRSVGDLTARIRAFIDGWNDRHPIRVDQDRGARAGESQPSEDFRSAALEVRPVCGEKDHYDNAYHQYPLRSARPAAELCR
jgi:hypothetical protein